MLVECYDLHLYCDGPDCPYKYEGPAQYAERNQLESYAAARKDGWTLYPKRNLAYCHRCKPSKGSRGQGKGRYKGARQPP